MTGDYQEFNQEFENIFCIIQKALVKFRLVLRGKRSELFLPRFTLAQVREDLVSSSHGWAVPFAFERHVDEVTHPVEIMLAALNQQLPVQLGQRGFFEPVFAFQPAQRHEEQRDDEASAAFQVVEQRSVS